MQDRDAEYALERGRKFKTQLIEWDSEDTWN